MNIFKALIVISLLIIIFLEIKHIFKEAFELLISWTYGGTQEEAANLSNYWGS